MLHAQTIWEEYQSRLRLFILSRVKDTVAADDILQDVFVKMFTSLSSLRDETRIQSWLYQIARNATMDYFRAQKKQVDLPDWLTQPEEFEEGAAQHLSHCLRPMVEQLPKTYREAVQLSELEGLPHQEIARRQGLSLSGVKSRVQRGRAILRSMFEDCCRFEFDRRGRIIHYEPRCDECAEE